MVTKKEQDDFDARFPPGSATWKFKTPADLSVAAVDVDPASPRDGMERQETAIRDSMSTEAKFHDEMYHLLWRGLCGCGMPKQAATLLRDVLTMLDNTATTPLTELLGPPDSGIYWWYLYFLDGLGLTRHGYIADAALLTTKGRAVSRYLNTHGTDPTHWPRVSWVLADGEWIERIGVD